MITSTKLSMRKKIPYMIPNHGYSQSHDYLTGFDGCRSKYRPNLMAADL